VNRKPPKRPDPREAAKRAALNALRRAKRAADKAGVVLSEWEGEFLESVSERVKGAPGTSLSMMQGRKLKEIAAKASGKEPKRRFGGRKPPAVSRPDDADD